MKSYVLACLTIPSPLQDSWRQSGHANDFFPGGPSGGTPGIILPGLPKAAGGMGSPRRVPVILSQGSSHSRQPLCDTKWHGTQAERWPEQAIDLGDTAKSSRNRHRGSLCSLLLGRAEDKEADIDWV